MRTKTLLLIAAVGAAGAATSMAQVFSVNAVGYVNKTIPANGFAMISNPLKAATNTIDALFTGAGIPPGTQVYVYTPGKGYDVGTYDDLDNSYGSTVGPKTLLPGQGVFVKNPTANPVTITFVGEVPQGTLNTAMVAGLQMVSSQVPQAGTPAELSFPHTGAEGLTAGDQVYKFVTNDPVPANNQKYLVATYDDLSDDWDKALTFDVGEAVFVKLAKPVTWTRQFNVNQ
jgi:hypothetical protein